MTEEQSSSVLDEHDIAELDELLAQLKNEDALHLDGAHGLLSALAVSPETVAPDEWLPLVIGKAPDVDNPELLTSLVERLVRLLQSIIAGLEHYTYDPIFSQHEQESAGGSGAVGGLDVDEMVLDVGGWCEGFSMGIDLRSAMWEGQMQADPQLVELLAPIVQLGVDDGVFADLQDDNIPALSDGEREQLIGQLASVLLDVKHYWEERDVLMRAERPPGAVLH
jgi:uncharacterized protein